MDHTIEEQLSALLDGELSVDEEDLVLMRLRQDADYRYRLGRYSFIGEWIRGSTVHPHSINIAERVRAALDAETAHTRKEKWSRMRTGLVAAGVAATVAGLAVISLNNLDNEPGSVARQAVAQTGSVMDSRMAISPGRLTSYLVSHGEFCISRL